MDQGKTSWRLRSGRTKKKGQGCSAIPGLAQPFIDDSLEGFSKLRPIDKFFTEGFRSGNGRREASRRHSRHSSEIHHKSI